MLTTTPSAKWVASKAASILRIEPNIGAKELQTRLQTTHGCEIPYHNVWRGKAKALEEVYGKWDDNFELLFRWKAEVMKRSPGSIVEIDVLLVGGDEEKPQVGGDEEEPRVGGDEKEPREGGDEEEPREIYFHRFFVL
jgi:hypothetical protein